MSNKLQSAMEYLMTYGWAILVIAVVLGVLYSLGIFSPSNFAPKATPGSCQVFRPNGPGTSYDVNLEGTCSGELPEYVGEFDSGAEILTANMQVSLPLTVSVWYYSDNGINQNWLNIVSIGPSCSFTSDSYIDINPHLNAVLVGAYVGTGGGNCNGYTDEISKSPISQNAWMHVVQVTTNTTQYFYLDGVLVNSRTGNYLTNAQEPLGIGSYGRGGFEGFIANIQVYNTSFSANAVVALYDEGIGGAPVDIQNLVDWWPLNGNANDYSGNNNNGVPTHVSYTGAWQNGYVTP